MNFKEIDIPFESALDLEQFKKMDFYAVENYFLPIELMMENAGLQLANLIVKSINDLEDKILIGVGNGNNGGGGLVAARRLSAWGFDVYLDPFTDINRELPKKQLERTISFGVKIKPIDNPNIWVDAYLGFSQKLPLREKLLSRVERANNCDCKRISLDIPTGFLGKTSMPYFESHQVLSLAASKKILYHLPHKTELYIADLGIPIQVYQKFGIEISHFSSHNILKIKR